MRRTLALAIAMVVTLGLGACGPKDQVQPEGPGGNDDANGSEERQSTSDAERDAESDTAEVTLPAPQALPEPQAEALGAEFPFESRYVDVHDARMHYVERGEGDPILFIHGNPTSAYLWRNVIPHVADEGRAIAMDLIGFGRSDKPELDYTFQDHYRYVEGFIEALGLENLTLVVHDWGSVLGLEYARRHPDNVKGVAMMEAIVPPAFPMESLAGMGDAAELFRQFREPETGRQLLMEENVFVEQILGGATVTRAMTEAEMEHYREPFPTPESRFPIYVWPNELPIGGEPARNVEVVRGVGDWLERSEIPKLLLYARPGAIIEPQTAAAMQARYRNLEAVFVGYGQHYIQEDNPEAIGRNVALWYRRIDR